MQTKRARYMNIIHVHVAAQFQLAAPPSGIAIRMCYYLSLASPATSNGRLYDRC